MEMIITGRMINAEEARSFGLINYLVKKEKLTDLKNIENNNKNIPLKIKLRGVQWSRTKCCWPEGDPKQNDFKFCGQDIFPGRPYCDKHSLLAYTNTRENS